MSDHDSDNICGFDMDYDGDRDFIDDIIFDEITDTCGEGSGSSYSGSNKSSGHFSIVTIVCVFFGIATAVSSGSIMSGIAGAFVMWLIVSYIKLFII